MVLKSLLRVRTCKKSPLLLQDNQPTSEQSPCVRGGRRQQQQQQQQQQSNANRVQFTKSKTNISRETADNSWYSYIESNGQALDDISSIHYGESVGSPHERHVARERERLRWETHKSRNELDGMTGKTASISDEEEDEDDSDEDSDDDLIYQHLDDVNPGPVDVDEGIYDPYLDDQEAMFRQQLVERQRSKTKPQPQKQQQQEQQKQQSQQQQRRMVQTQHKKEQSRDKGNSLEGPDFDRRLTDEDFDRVLSETGAQFPDPCNLNVSSFTSATDVELDYDDNTNVELVGRRSDDSDQPSTTVQIVAGPEVQLQDFVEDDEELLKRRTSQGHRQQRLDRIVAASLGAVTIDEDAIDENPIYMAKDLAVFCVSLLKQSKSYMHKQGLIPSSNNNDNGNYLPPKSPTERVVRDTLQRHLDRFVQDHSARTGKEHHRRKSWMTFDRKLTKLMLQDPYQVEELAQDCVADADYEQAIRFYALLLEQQQKIADAETAETLTKLSLLHLVLGNRNRAIGFAKRALKWNREESRREATTVSLLLIGLIYLAGNKPDKALTTWREALQMSCLVFGYDHPFLATLLNNIGCLHYYRGDMAASLRTFSESLDMQRKFLSTNSSYHANTILLDIAVTKGNMAIMASKQGDVTAAASLLEEVLSIQESVLQDRDHFLVTLTKHNLDRLLDNEPEIFGDDEDMSIEEREARNLFLNGDDNGGAGSGSGSTSISDASVTSETAISSRKLYFSNVVSSCKTSGTSQNAQKEVQRGDSFSIERIHSISSRVSSHLSVFGDDDGIPMRRVGVKSPLDALDATDNLDILMLGPLANELTPRQRVREAVLKFFNKTLQDDEDRKLPFVPFDRAPRRRNRIPIDLDQDNVVDAELHLEGIHDQAYEHLEHNEIEEALELFECVLSSHKDKFGPIHHLVGTCNHNIGLVYLYAERYTPAMAFFQEAVAIRQASLGPEHPDVASSLMKIGMIQLARRDADEARDTFKQVLDLSQDGLGYGHIQIARVLNNLAVSFYDLGSYLECFKAFEQAYEIQQRLLFLSVSEYTAVLNQTEIIEIALANTLLNMGFLYARQKKYMDALRMIREGCKLRQKYFDADSPELRSAENNLAHVKLLLGDNYESDDDDDDDEKKVDEDKPDHQAQAQAQAQAQVQAPPPGPLLQWRQIREHSMPSVSLSSSVLAHQHDMLESFVGDAFASIKGTLKCYIHP